MGAAQGGSGGDLFIRTSDQARMGPEPGSTSQDAEGDWNPEPPYATHQVASQRYRKTGGAPGKPRRHSSDVAADLSHRLHCP